MKKMLQLFPYEDTFAQAPLYCLLPVRGNVKALSELSTGLHARYENVKMLKEDLRDSGVDQLKKITAEGAMLNKVFDKLKQIKENNGEEVID